MCKSSVIKEIISNQHENGAYPSSVHLPRRKVTDHNVFVTALILDFLYDHIGFPYVRESAEKAIQFILSSQCPSQEGQFRFYPLEGHPKWMNETLNLDIDDSALCTRILLQYGIWSQEKVTRIVEKMKQSYSLKRQPDGACWFRAGVYPTWLDRSLLHNPIDVVANLNMLHLIYVSNCDNAFYAPIIEMTNHAIENLNEKSSMELISPYYAQTYELLHALERCEIAGVPEMKSTIEKYHEKNYSVPLNRKEMAICCSYGNKVFWSSKLLTKIRDFQG